jgi:hypothetical protein
VGFFCGRSSWLRFNEEFGLDWLVEGEGLVENIWIGLWNKDRAFKVCFIVLSTVSADGVVMQDMT